MDIQKIMKLEALISSEIRRDNGATLSFNYERNNDAHTARVFTLNPKTDEFFLLASATSYAQEAALVAVLDYVKNHKNEMNNYAVRWLKKSGYAQKDGDGKTNTSHFFCRDVAEVVEKFFAGKDSSMYIVYEIKLCPMA